MDRSPEPVHPHERAAVGIETKDLGDIEIDCTSIGGAKNVTESFTYWPTIADQHLIAIDNKNPVSLPNLSHMILKQQPGVPPKAPLILRKRRLSIWSPVPHSAV
jgi:hypothetical protein